MQFSVAVNFSFKNAGINLMKMNNTSGNLTYFVLDENHIKHLQIFRSFCYTLKLVIYLRMKITRSSANAKQKNCHKEERIVIAIAICEIL